MGNRQELAEQMEDFNARLASIVENGRLSLEGKSQAIGLLVTLRAPMFRSVAAALRDTPPHPKEG